MIRIAINGLGRIGRRLTRILCDQSDIDLVAINDIMPFDTALYLLRYDSTYGPFHDINRIDDSKFSIGRQHIIYTQISNIDELPWGDLNLDVIVNCSGTNKNVVNLSKYIQFGTRQVILSSPPDDMDIPISVYGFNHHEHSSAPIISNASCTTYSIIPILDIVDSHFGVNFLHFTTIHCYTNDQNLQDANHTDFRRARAAAVNIIPTSTSATRVLTRLFPKLSSSFMASSYRVPVANGSITEMVFDTIHHVSHQELVSAIQRCIETKYSDSLMLSDQPIVSGDCIMMPYAAIIDGLNIEVVNDRKVRIVSFYDNEHGYATMLLYQIKSLLNK